jgi:hypothetical protein
MRLIYHLRNVQSTVRPNHWRRPTNALLAIQARYGLEMDLGSIPALVERHGLVSEEPA